MAATWSLRAPVPRDQPVRRGVTIMEGVIAPVDQEHVGQLLPMWAGKNGWHLGNPLGHPW